MTGRPPRRVTLWKRPAPWTAHGAVHRALANAQPGVFHTLPQGIIMSGEQADRTGAGFRTLRLEDVVE